MTEMAAIKNSVSLSYRQYYANIMTMEEKNAEIYRLKQETEDQKRRIDELVEQTQRSNQFNDEEQESEVDQLRRELQDQDADMIEAEKTIEMLIRDVQVAREVATRAEKAQREAEADQMLRHVLRDSDDESQQSTIVAQLQSELERVTNAEQQSSRRASEMEQELTVLRDTAEMLSLELEASRNKRHEMEVNDQAVVQELKETKAKAEEATEHWKAVANVCQELVSTLQTQVKALHSDKDNLENAIALCQRSANKRLQNLENDQQTIEAENAQLLTELTSIRQDLEAMNIRFRELEEEGVSKTAKLKQELDRRLAHTQTTQKQLASCKVKAEQKLILAASTSEIADEKQSQKTKEQLTCEIYELQKQLEEERRQSKELKCSTAMFQTATESALKELKDVEIELRVINSDYPNGGGQHESLMGLVKQVVAEFKRQDGASMEAVVASMQVQYLTTLMHAHLNRLCTLREYRKGCCTSPNSSDSYSASGSAATSPDIVSNLEGDADIGAVPHGTHSDE